MLTHQRVGCLPASRLVTQVKMVHIHVPTLPTVSFPDLDAMILYNSKSALERVSNAHRSQNKKEHTYLFRISSQLCHCFL